MCPHSLDALSLFSGDTGNEQCALVWPDLLGFLDARKTSVGLEVKELIRGDDL